MNSVMNKMKWFVISCLIILVVGMTLIGIFGLNKPIDYKDSYEINVSIELDDDTLKQTMKETSDEYFEEKDIKVLSFQSVEGGMRLIYKFSADQTSVVTELEQILYAQLKQESYEINIDTNLDDDTLKQTMEETADKYFEENGIEVVSSQSKNEGKSLTYVFTTDQTSVVTALKQIIADTLKIGNDKLTVECNEVVLDNKLSVVCNQVSHGSYVQPLKILLAYGIALVAIFVYMLIMNKLASAVAVICSSVASIILFLAMLAITRIPAVPFVEISAMIAGVLGGLLSVSMVGRYREEIKNTTTAKFSVNQIADNVAKTEFKKYLYILVAVCIASVAVSAFFMRYMLIIGGQLLLAGIVSVASAYFVTPLLWTAIKAKHRKAKSVDKQKASSIEE